MRRRQVSKFAISLALLVAGCGSPRGTLGEANLSIGGGSFPTETVLTATTRARSANPSVFFSGERARGLDFAQVSVSVPPSHEPGNVERASASPDPRRSFVTTQRKYVDDGQGFISLINREIGRADRQSDEIFLFVHGYNNTFAEGVYRTAQIRHDFDLPAVAVHYSWPSAAKPQLYVYDRDSAHYARDGLIELLELLNRSKARKIFVVGHSMGAFVLMEALRQAHLSGKSHLFSRMSNVVLASPDIDVDVFREQVKGMRPDRPRMVVLVSSDDRALRFSERLRGGHPRVGQGRNIDGLTAMGITVFDLSDTETIDRLNHSKFASSPSFIKLVKERFITQQTIRSAAARGKQTTVTPVSVIGDAANLVIHLPERLISPQ